MDWKVSTARNPHRDWNCFSCSLSRGYVVWARGMLQWKKKRQKKKIEVTQTERKPIASQTRIFLRGIADVHQQNVPWFACSDDHCFCLNGLWPTLDAVTPSKKSIQSHWSFSHTKRCTRNEYLFTNSQHFLEATREKKWELRLYGGTKRPRPSHWCARILQLRDESHEFRDEYGLVCTVAWW